MSQVTRDSHYVPRFYLKRWAHDTTRIWTYRTLVSHKGVPVWVLRSIESTAYVTDLYSSLFQDRISDEFERWIQGEFEAPALKSIEKLEDGSDLTDQDIRNLVRFLSLQDVRTPQNFFETEERWRSMFPEIAEHAIGKLESLLHKGEPLDLRLEVDAEPHPMRGIHVDVARSETGSPDMLNITITGKFDRDTWIEEQRRLLSGVAKRLLRHSWSIVEAHPSMKWLTSDHPVVRLNYYGPYQHDLKGGWDRKKGNVFMPLTPRFLLFTQIGDPAARSVVFPRDKTLEINDMIVERAFRFVFSIREMHRVKHLRPRVVDADRFEKERQYWTNWRLNFEEQDSSENHSI